MQHVRLASGYAAMVPIRKMRTDVPEVVVKGCDYEVVRDTMGKDVIVNVMGYPGTKANISLDAGGKSFNQARLEGQSVDKLLKGRKISRSGFRTFEPKGIDLSAEL